MGTTPVGFLVRDDYERSTIVSTFFRRLFFSPFFHSSLSHPSALSLPLFLPALALALSRVNCSWDSSGSHSGVNSFAPSLTSLFTHEDTSYVLSDILTDTPCAIQIRSPFITRKNRMNVYNFTASGSSESNRRTPKVRQNRENLVYSVKLWIKSHNFFSKMEICFHNTINKIGTSYLDDFYKSSERHQLSVESGKM